MTACDEQTGSSLESGFVLDERFQIVAPVGAGGFGHVYLANQLGLDRVVAVKVLDGKVEPDVWQRFEREARILMTLRHRNVVQFYGYGMIWGRPYMALEFVPGDHLGKLLEAGPLDALQTTRLLQQVCAAMHCAHINGIVHRDLKPNNILLTGSPPKSKWLK